MEIPTDAEFEEMINDGIARLPKLYRDNLANVGFIVSDQPTQLQRKELKLRCNETLFGLYEGIPLTKRGSGFSGILPDKITIFKLPMVAASRNRGEIAEQVRHTVWHEVAHYYGLGHTKIHKLDGTTT